jgi:hypothetical protein
LRISLINQSDVAIHDVREAIQALNHQIARDLAPHWGRKAHVSLCRTKKAPASAQGVVHLVNTADGDFHWEPDDKPVAQVMTAFTKKALEQVPFMYWTNGLSHEILEMVADPDLTRLMDGPHPNEKRTVQYYCEICDPVQSQMYEIDGVQVTNFVLPDYFNANGPTSRKTNFLGKRLEPFGWAKDGEVGFYDPKLNEYVTYPQYEPHHPAAKKRKAKGSLDRYHRYAVQHRHDTQE